MDITKEELETEIERWKNDEVRGLKYIINLNKAVSNNLVVHEPHKLEVCGSNPLTAIPSKIGGTL